MRVFYTALFEKVNNSYSVTFPALRNCVAKGKGFEEAYKNAQDAIANYLFACEKKDFKYPKDIPNVEIKLFNADTVSVCCDLDSYREKEPVEICLPITEWKYLIARVYYHYGDLSELFEEGLREHVVELKNTEKLHRELHDLFKSE